MKIIPAIAVLTAVLSLASWTYRFIDAYMRYSEIWIYIAIPVVFWVLFAGPLFLLRRENKYLRIIAAVLLVPTSVLWALSVQIGFFGLDIH